MYATLFDDTLMWMLSKVASVSINHAETAGPLNIAMIDTTNRVVHLLRG